MKYILIILSALFITSCAGIKTVTATTGVGVGLPQDPEDHTGVYNRNVNVTVNGTYTAGYGRSRIFGEYGHLGVSHNGYYVGYTNYHNDWGHWVTVKKTITLFDKKKRDKKKKNKKK